MHGSFNGIRLRKITSRKITLNAVLRYIAFARPASFRNSRRRVATPGAGAADSEQ
jgi:hypothetical protein